METKYFKKTNILWDWNGTLLDDIEICIKGINILLEARQKKGLDREHYREIFTFPVKQYYRLAGLEFEKEQFEIPAEQFIVHYKDMLPEARLFDDVEETLLHFKKLGFNQFVVSAMEQRALEKSIEERGISTFFQKICGINDNLARSKIENARKLISTSKINPMETILIGDTIHDAEVAKEIGVDVVLVSRGHQSAHRLKKFGVLVVNNLADVGPIINFS